MKKKLSTRVFSAFLAILMMVSIVPMGTITASAVDRSQIVDYARTFIGCKYVPGKAGPTEFDCSGFTKYVFVHFGITLPHSSKDLFKNCSNYGVVVGSGSTTNAKPGDLIVWDGHVAIYTGNGKCIEALNQKYGVTESFAVNNHSHGLNYKVLRVNGVYDFKPRTTASDLPKKTDKWILKYNLSNNCARYACARAAEILNTEITKYGISSGNPAPNTNSSPQKIYNQLSKYFPTGNTPKPGAVGVTSSYSHIFVVEKVNSNNTMIISEGNSYSNPANCIAKIQNGKGIIGRDTNTYSSKGNGSWCVIRQTAISSSYKYVYLISDSGAVSKAENSVQTDTKVVASSGNNYYNANANKTVGQYQCTATSGVNIRTGYGTNNKKIGLVTYKSKINVIKVNGNWGYCSYNGKEGWVCLNYFKKISEPAPVAPSISVDSTIVAQNKKVTLTYSASNATKYYVYQNGTEVYNGASKTFVASMNTVGTSTFYVVGENSSGVRGAASAVVNVEVKAPLKVNFVDYDGKLLSAQTVNYGESAVAPINAPERKGYTFNGWNQSYAKITEDLTVTAQYTKKTYKVNFYGQKNDDGSENLLATRNVKYGENATPPTDTKPKTGYIFKGWNSEAYKNVYINSNDSTINIYGIYEWENYDLPILIQNVDAVREASADGYAVKFSIKNGTENAVKGRAIITLKTSEGKLISTTESASFKLVANGTKTFDEFVNCDRVATSVEIVIVNSFSSGVPISPKYSGPVNTSLMWSEWQDTMPTGDGIIVDSPRILYRSRTKQTATNSRKTLDGYIWDGTYTVNEGGWSYWYDGYTSPISNESLKREVETRNDLRYDTRTAYPYYHYYKAGAGDHRWEAYDHKKLGGYSEHTTVSYYNPLPSNGNSTCTGVPRYKGVSCSTCGASLYWFGRDAYTDYYNPHYVAQYRYKDTTFSYNFYKWNAWSDWSTLPVTASDSIEVETKTQYRYQADAFSLEDKTGVTRTTSGSLDASLAGKQISLFVYKYNEASDFTDEFVGQTVIDKDGSYSFTYKLREEPSVKTGDFTVAVGIEGTTELKIIGTIEAPKPVYTVNFYDGNGDIISTQTITEGNNAEVPEVPGKTGYRFIGWDKNTTNIHDNLDIFPILEKEEYTVVFVDWIQQTIETKKFKYGEVITAPSVEELEGYTFDGWDVLQSGIVEASQDLVITAEYTKKEYKVEFVDHTGSVISTQMVKYDESAIIPEYSDDITVIDFFNSNEYQNVKHDTVIYPEYFFEETAITPIPNYTSGEYSTPFDLTLTTSDSSTIFYSINDSEEEFEYTGPIHIDKSCSITYYSQCLGKNDSQKVTEYYCINNTTPSDWMEYSQLPKTVTDNLDMYNLEDAVVSKYKYIHYKYTDSEGVIQYSKNEVENSTYEEIILDSKLTVAGFDDNSVSYYSYNNQIWFTQTKVNVNIYRYTNKVYHILSFIDTSEVKETVFVEHGEKADISSISDLYGYQFDGLYTDPDFTEYWDENLRVMESMTLYMKYTPNKYNVVFQMQDGTELDSQQVDYLAAAIEPDTDSVPGWVFSGWDKDFSSITKDTVVTGTYVKESEYARISVNLPKLMMYRGNIAKLTATITPSNLSDQDVAWGSSDLNVATVDNNGIVSAVGPGTATIFAVAVTSGERATCEVTVTPDTTVNILLKDSATVGLDSERNLRLSPMTHGTVTQIKEQFQNDKLEFYNIDGVKLSDDENITTGTVVKLIYNGAAVDSITAIFTGDFNCDGLINNKDIVMINQYVLATRAANRYQMIAIDVNGDGYVNNRDCAMLSRYLVGKEVL